jgi:hypothetical protein
MNPGFFFFLLPTIDAEARPGRKYSIVDPDQLSEGMIMRLWIVLVVVAVLASPLASVLVVVAR